MRRKFPTRTSAHRAFPLAIALGGFIGCRPQDRPESNAADQTTPGTAGPAAVTLTATDYAFGFPDTVVAGWTTFHLVNHGSRPHMAQLIRLESGMTVEQFLEAYGEAFRSKGPRPEWARRLGGPTVTAPHATSNATLELGPGNYLWICLYNLPDGVPHVVGHGMAEAFVVQPASGTEPARAAPEADIVMRLLDYSFSLSAPLAAGRHTIRVENAGTESHEVSVTRLAAGKTIEDLRAWLRNPGERLPDSVGSVAGGVTSLAPGAEAYFEVDLTPGEYLLLCFVTAPDGRSHIDHGMIQQIKVS
jgi:hypothetical protein